MNVKTFYCITVIFFIQLVGEKVAHISNTYAGEHFPEKYLEVDPDRPNVKDLDRYLKSAYHVMFTLGNSLNDTDINANIGSHILKVMLKVTLRDYGHKLKSYQISLIKTMLRAADNIVSHFEYSSRPRGIDDTLYRVTQLLRDDYYFLNSVRKLNHGSLKKWIRKVGMVNEYVEDMDKATLARDKYLEQTQDGIKYYIAVEDSDHCLGEVFYNSDPADMQLRSCRPDPYCKRKISSSPSIGYTLSHRLVVLLFSRFFKRCFLDSPEQDLIHMEVLCSFMYREATYIARRGFFARDLFLEHIALCGLMGHEEFLRHHWFNKVTSWIDEHGCLAENKNWEINRTRVLLSKPGMTKSRATRLRYIQKRTICSDCHAHPMAMGIAALAQGIRYAAHYI